MPLLVLKASRISSFACFSRVPSLSLSFLLDFSFLLHLLRRTFALALRAEFESPPPVENIDYRYLLPCGQHALPIYPDINWSNGTMYDFRSRLDIVECIASWSKGDFHVLNIRANSVKANTRTTIHADIDDSARAYRSLTFPQQHRYLSRSAFGG